jgi:hypothetical protein
MDLPIFQAVDDCPHQPGPDPSWQESALYTWYDPKAGLGGFWRLGQEPNAGALNSCFGVFTDDGMRFRSNVTGVPMAASDRGEAHMGWGPHLRVDYDGHADIKADFPDCEAQLRFEDYHPRYDYMKLVGQSIDNTHHFEVAGRMAGKVRLGDREIEIDAVGYRDRSWSNRDWGRIRGTRWWPCVFGPDLSLHLLHAVVDTGQLVKVGYLLRDGKATIVTDSEIIVHLETDAVSYRTGTGRLRLETGEELEVRFEYRDGIVLHVRGYTAMEAVGRAFMGGREGFSTLEVCTNPAGGSNPPALTIAANNGQGLSRRP